MPLGLTKELWKQCRVSRGLPGSSHRSRGSLQLESLELLLSSSLTPMPPAPVNQAGFPHLLGPYPDLKS